MKCCGLEKLLQFHRGMCTDREARSIADHLHRCHRCQQNMKWLDTVLRLAAQDDSADPPPWVVQRAIDLFAQHGPSPMPSLLSRIVAALVFDSAAQPGLVGVRSLGVATRKCLYRWEGYDIDLSFEPANGSDRVTVTGQILGPSETFRDVSGVSVQLRKGEEVIAETATNHLGEFTFERIAVGVYELKMTLQGKEAWITPLEVKAVTEERGDIGRG